MNAHRPFMLAGERELRVCVPANDATTDEWEGVEDMAPGAAFAAFIAMWFAENRFALAIGFYAGCMLSVGLAWCLGRVL